MLCVKALSNLFCLVYTSHFDYSGLATTASPAMASAGPGQAVVQGPPQRYREEWSGCVSWPSDIAGLRRSTTDSKGMWEVRVCLITLLQTTLHVPTRWRCYPTIISQVVVPCLAF